MDKLASRIKTFDLYPKLMEEVKVKTFSGAAVSIVAAIMIAVLFFSELSIYMTPERVDRLVVDKTRGEKLMVSFDITFPRLPCSLLTMTALDVAGESHLDLEQDIRKRVVTPSGEVLPQELKYDLSGAAKDAARITSDDSPSAVQCGSCYGAESRPGMCCNTCDEVKEQYRLKRWTLPSLDNIEQCVREGQSSMDIRVQLQRKEGCRIYGNFKVNKVAGNIYLSPGRSFRHSKLHAQDPLADPSIFDVSHTVNRLQFGFGYPGMVNPLDSTSRTYEGPAMHMYYVKVVPTTFEPASGEKTSTNQYSVTEHMKKLDPTADSVVAKVGKQAAQKKKKKGENLKPSVYFFYELSPIMVRVTERRKPFLHFITQLCAILGGIFTVAGLVDRFVYASLQHVQKKIELGKFS